MTAVIRVLSAKSRCLKKCSGAYKESARFRDSPEMIVARDLTVHSKRRNRRRDPIFNVFPHLLAAPKRPAPGDAGAEPPTPFPGTTSINDCNGAMQGGPVRLPPDLHFLMRLERSPAFGAMIGAESKVVSASLAQTMIDPVKHRAVLPVVGDESPNREDGKNDGPHRKVDG